MRVSMILYCREDEAERGGGYRPAPGEWVLPGGGPDRGEPGGGGRGGGGQKRQGDSADPGHGLQCTDTDSWGKPHRTSSKASVISLPLSLVMYCSCQGLKLTFFTTRKQNFLLTVII